MKVDKAHAYTDRQLLLMERELKQIYTKAYKEMKAEMVVITSKINTDPLMTLEQKVALMNKYDRLDKLSVQLADSLSSASNEAIKIMNNGMLNIYRENYNFEADKFKFALLDRETVKQILSKEISPFTLMSYEGLKDKNVMIRDLKSELMTSILKGESIPQIAKRIKERTEKTMRNSIRIARTETTQVENAARFDVGKHGEELGFTMMKEWVATSDDRTRDAHNEADGQRVPVDQPFIVDGEELMYPGDVSMGASPENTINCRCSMVNIIVDKNEKAKK